MGCLSHASVPKRGIGNKALWPQLLLITLRRSLANKIISTLKTSRPYFLGGLLMLFIVTKKEFLPRWDSSHVGNKDGAEEDMHILTCIRLNRGLQHWIAWHYTVYFIYRIFTVIWTKSTKLWHVCWNCAYCLCVFCWHKLVNWRLNCLIMKSNVSMRL